MAFLMAFIASISAATWIYTKLQRQTGYGNSSNAIKGAAIAGGIVFVVVLSLGLMVF